MLERYTEKARRVIFFARGEAGQLGSPYIGAEHLLLCLFQADQTLADRYLPSDESAESIRKRILARVTRGEPLPDTVDLPLSHECKRVLAHAAEEAQQLNHKHIGAEHLLLGLLREEQGLASDVLRQLDLEISQVRDRVGGAPAPTPTDAARLLQTTLRVYLQSLHREFGITLATESRIEVRADRNPQSPPFLCIEIVSPEDRFRGVVERVDRYLHSGVRWVWLFNPETRHVYLATAEAGLQEFKGAVLRTENPILELPLSEVFG
jgi:hypothetical protein